MALTEVLPCVTCPARSVYPLHLLLTYRTGSYSTGERARLSAAQKTHLVSFRSQSPRFRSVRCRPACPGQLVKSGQFYAPKRLGLHTLLHMGRQAALLDFRIYSPGQKAFCRGKVSLSRNPSPGLQEELRPLPTSLLVTFNFLIGEQVEVPKSAEPASWS